MDSSNSPRAEPKVHILIVNWNGAEYLTSCLESVYGQRYRNIEVWLVDNGSTDDSVDLVRKDFPQANVLALGENLGFVGGNNAGIQRAMQAKADYVMLLNNDTTVTPDWLVELVHAAESDPTIGVCFSKILLHGSPEIINSAGGECDIWGFPRDRGYMELDAGQYERLEDVFEGCGASMLIKREVVEKVGGLDDKLFMYDEDTDYAWRARLSGYRVVYVPLSVLYHHFGGTGGSANARRRYLATRNMLRSILKNAGPSLLARMLPGFLMMKAGQIALFLVTGRIGVALAITKALLWNVRHLPDTLTARRSIQGSRKVPDKSIKDLLVRRSLELEMLRSGHLSRFKPGL